MGRGVEGLVHFFDFKSNASLRLQVIGIVVRKERRGDVEQFPAQVRCVGEIVHQRGRGGGADRLFANQIVETLIASFARVLHLGEERVERDAGDGIRILFVLPADPVDLAEDFGETQPDFVVFAADDLLVGMEGKIEIFLQMLRRFHRSDDAATGVAQFVKRIGLPRVQLRSGAAREGDNLGVETFDFVFIPLVDVDRFFEGRVLDDLFERRVGNDLRGLEADAFANDREGVVKQVDGFLAHRFDDGVGKSGRSVGEVARLRLCTAVGMDDAFEKPHHRIHERQHEKDPEEVEHGVENSQLQRVVVVGDAEATAHEVDEVGELVNKADRDECRRRVENEVSGGKLTAGDVRPEGSDDGGDGGADVGSDRERECIFVSHLARAQCGDDDDEGGMARLHDDGGENAERDEEKDAGVTAHRIGGEVEVIGESFESGLHVVDPEKEKSESGEDVSHSAERLRSLKNEDDAEHDHRHRVGRDFHLQPEAGDEPGPGRRPEIRAEDDPDAGKQGNESGGKKRYCDDRDERTRLHDRGRDHPEPEALPRFVGGLFEESFEDASRENFKAFLEAEHAEQEDADSRCDLFEIRTDPEPIREQNKDQWEENLAQHQNGMLKERPKLSIRIGGAAFEIDAGIRAADPMIPTQRGGGNGHDPGAISRFAVPKKSGEPRGAVAGHGGLFFCEPREVDRGERISVFIFFVGGIPRDQTVSVVEFDESGIGIVASARELGELL